MSKVYDGQTIGLGKKKKKKRRHRLVGCVIPVFLLLFYFKLNIWRLLRKSGINWRVLVEEPDHDWVNISDI